MVRRTFAGKKSTGRKIMALCLSAVLAAGAVMAAGCGSSKKDQTETSGNSEQGSDNSITVINYGEYLDPDLLQEFEQETGIKVKYEEATTPEEMYSKYKSGAINYDLVCTSEYMVERLMQEDDLRTIDWSGMEYVNNIGEDYWEMCTSFDPTRSYAMPYFWGTVGLLYNTEMVDDEIDSWDVLFNGEYSGEIIMQNSVRDAFMVAEKYLGYSLNTTDTGEINKAFQLLIDQKKDVEAYFVDEVREEMVAENAAIAVCYSGEAYLANEYNENLTFVVPKEGSNLWVDCWVMPKSGKNPEGAQKFLDFLNREDVAMTNFEYVYYPTPNETVMESLDEETKNDPLVFPTKEAYEKCEVYRQLDDKTTALYNKLWKELKSE